MTARERRIDQADRAAKLALVTLGREIREARIAAGLSQDAVAVFAGVSGSRISRLERAEVRTASIHVLSRLCTGVGLGLAVRAYPGGDPVRDAAHVRLLERFRGRLHPSLRWRTEVPLPLAGDKRAWDAVISGPQWSIAVEAETRLWDVQALTRRVALKRRDGRIDRLILLLADTRTNRSALLVARAALAEAFPGAQAAILGALARGEEPGKGGIVIL